MNLNLDFYQKPKAKVSAAVLHCPALFELRLLWLFSLLYTLKEEAFLRRHYFSQAQETLTDIHIKNLYKKGCSSSSLPWHWSSSLSSSLQIPWSLQPCSAHSSLLHYLHMALGDILFSPFAMKKSILCFWTCQSAWNVVPLYSSPFKGSVTALCRNGHVQLSVSYRQMNISHCFP